MTFTKRERECLFAVFALANRGFERAKEKDLWPGLRRGYGPRRARKLFQKIMFAEHAHKKEGK